jgi:hypothetical protein
MIKKSQVVTHPTFENERTFGRTYPFGTKGVIYGFT